MKKSRKIAIGILSFLIIVAYFYYPRFQRVWWFMHMFDKEQIVENFQHMNQLIPVREVEKSVNPYEFPLKSSFNLPDSFAIQNRVFNTQQYLDSSFTTGFMVIQDDSLAFEDYYLGNSPSTRHIAWSMSKSFVSALVGIAIDEGYIKTIQETVDVYLPELKGSGYEGVRIKDILQMSTGVKFNEDYADFYSDINNWGRKFAWGSSQNTFAASLENEHQPGTYNHYVSINTHVLGMLIVKTTGRNLSDYLQEKIWQKIGMEFNGYWLMDNYGMEMALGGLNASLRDFAKLGQLYLQDGFWNGEEIVPKDWVKASITPDAPHLMPGKRETSSHLFGYGFQWWIPEGDEGEFMALGVYNQYIYINPMTRTVIVKNSANYRYNEANNDYRSTTVILELFRKIAHLK